MWDPSTKDFLAGCLVRIVLGICGVFAGFYVSGFVQWVLIFVGSFILLFDGVKGFISGVKNNWQKKALQIMLVEAVEEIERMKNTGPLELAPPPITRNKLEEALMKFEEKQSRYKVTTALLKLLDQNPGAHILP